MPVSCLVTSVAWERVNLAITVALSGEPEPPAPSDEAAAALAAVLAPTAGTPDARTAAAPELAFYLVDGIRGYPVEFAAVGAGAYRLKLNVTNFRDRRQIPDGTWRIVPVAHGWPQPPATYDVTATARLDEWSRTFLYARNHVAYVVGFGLTEADEVPAFLLRSYQLFRHPRPSASAEKPPPLARLQRRVYSHQRRVQLVNDWYQAVRRVERPHPNRILFASERRSSIEGNLARVRDRMLERGLDRQFDLRYSFRLPHTGRKTDTLRTIYLLATSGIVLIDDYYPLLESLKLADDTKVIQLWHAGSGFKSVGFSRFGNYGSPRLQNVHRKYTFAITGSTHLVPVYAEAFGIEESAVIPTGLPRIDTFLDPAHTASVVQRFHQQYPTFTGKRIVLFAPTFRGRNRKDAYYDYARLDFDRLYEACGDHTVVLFRIHPFVADPIPIPSTYADRLFDFGSFPDVNDLLHVTDVLITDYSSIIYEFSLLDRPMLFFAYDKDVYAATRGFHRDYDETAPGKICVTFDELLKALQDEDYEMERVAVFRRENFDHVDTDNADRFIDQLILTDPRAAHPVLAGTGAGATA